MKNFLVKNIVILSLVFCVSCISNIKEHGILVKDTDLEKLRIGGSKEFIVKQTLGPPSIEEQIDESKTWLYINYKKNKKPLKKAKLIHYEIIELLFDNSRLSAINKYDLADMHQIAFNSHTTISETEKRNIFMELFRNIGRFDGENDI